MWTRTACVALALLSAGAPAAGQTVLSEADAVAQLSPDSPRIRTIRSAADIARADVGAAARWPNPIVTFNREAVAGVTEHMLLITQPLAITGRRQLEADAAAALVDASVRRGDEEVRTVRAALRLAYTDLVLAQRQEAAWAAARDRLTQIAGLVAQRERAGDAAGYDSLRAEREVIAVEESLSAARVARARAQADLGGFLAQPGDTTLLAAATPGPVANPVPVPGLDELLLRARSVRGEVAASEKEIESARLGERAAGRRLVPEPELVAGTKWSTFGGGDVGGVVAVHVPLPVFNAAKPEQARARARLAQAEASAAAFDVSLRAQVAGVRAALLEHRAAADRHRAFWSTRADQLERIAQVSYDAGEQGILDLLDAYRSGAAGRVRQAELDAAVRRAEIELELVTGWEMQ